MARRTSGGGARFLKGPLASKEGRKVLWIVGAAILLLVLAWAGPGWLADRAPSRRTPRAAIDAPASSAPERAAALNFDPAAPETAPPIAAKRKRAFDQDDAGLVSPLELGAVLCGVIVLIVLSAFGLRKLLRRTRLAAGSERLLHLVDALPLGPKRHVYAVKLRGRLLVVGCGGEDVSLLAEYDEEEWTAAATVSANAAAPPTAAPAPPPPPRTTIATPAPKPKVEANATPKAAPQTAKGRGGAATHARKSYDATRRQVEATQDASPRAADQLPGAHRVPPAFRHLLEGALAGHEGESDA